MSRIFLSHSSRDTRQAVALKQWLIEQTPPLANEIFLDVDPDSGLRAGTRWKDALRQANSRCEAVICLLSANWEASHECKVEYRTAENLNKQIFVARLEPSTGDDLTSEWQRCDLFADGSTTTSIDIGDGPSVEFSTAGLYRLRDGIRGAGIGADSFVWPPTGDHDRAPYRGWEPLDEADAAVFFGRDAQIVRALDTLRGMRTSGVDPLFVVLGPSGTGKSSFLRAGLLPRLRREDRRFAVMDIVRPERNAMTGTSGLASAIAATRESFGLKQPSLGAIKELCTAADTGALITLLDEIRREAARRLLERGDDAGTASAPTLVLPVDQAEELFATDSTAVADDFLRTLAEVAAALNTEDLGLVVAATIRTDRYEVMQTHPSLAGLGTVLFDELKPMPPTQFKEVITGPAQRASESGRTLRVAPDLVDQLLADASDGGDTLPILALTLSRLYTDYGSTGELTLASYRTLGGMRRVVQTEIDEVLTSDPRQRAAELTALRSAFIPWLATINADNDQPMRRVARWMDLPVASRPLIDALVAKRLMVKDNRDGQVVVEVALESLLRQWDELAGWLREERKDLKDADDIERACAAWNLSNHNPSWLLEGSRLAEATKLANEPGFRDRLVATHPFLTASYQREQQRRAAEEQQQQSELRAAQERAHHAQERAQHAQEQQAVAERHTATLRKRSRILRAVVAITAVVAVVAAVGFVRANSATNEARRQFREATSARLTSDAWAMLDGSLPGGDVRALQQLVAGQTLAQSQSRDVLFDSAVSTAGLSKIMQTTSQVVSIAVSPDGSLVAAGGDGVIWLWEADTGRQRGEPLTGHDGAVGTVVFNADGTRLASGGDDSTIRIWDVETGAQTQDPLTVEGTDGVRVRQFNAAGNRLIFQGSDGSLWGWPIAGGNADQIFDSGVGTLAVSPARNRLATADDDIIKIWDIETGNQIGGDITASDQVLSLAFSGDGSRLASGGLDAQVQLWDAANATPVGAPMTDGTAEVVWLAFPQRGSFLAAASSDGTVRFYDAESQSPLGAPLSALDGFPQGLQIDDDGRRLVVGGSDNTVRIYDVSAVVPVTGQTSAFSGDGSLLVTGGKDGRLRKVDRDTGRMEVMSGPGPELIRLAFLPDSNRMVAGDAAGTLRLWDVDSGRQIGSDMPGTGAAVFSLGVSGSGQVVAGYRDGAVRLWDPESGRLVRPAWRSGSKGVSSVGFIDDDTQVFAVAVGDSAELFTWNVDDGKQVDRRSIGGDVFIAVAPDGRVLAGRIDGNVTFLTAFDDGETIGGQPVRAHGDVVAGVTFAPGGHLAASSARDGSVRLWDADTAGAIGRPLSVSPTIAPILAFSPDATTLAASGEDNATRLWPTSGSVDQLCAKLTANMSRKQWDEWVSPDIDYVQACPDLPIASD